MGDERQKIGGVELAVLMERVQGVLR